MGTEAEFQGTIARTREASSPWWPPAPRPPDGAPNVLVIVLDDVGFAQLGCYGSDIDTPTFDRLAAGGLQFTNFHTTALCSPTRACVLTGRNHHSAGMGRVIDLATGFPGYDARIPRSVGLLPEMLVPHGYAAYAVGKWHLLPKYEHSLGSPRHGWPLGRGFERFYGFFDGETSQFGPSLVHDNHLVPPPATIDEGYHLTEDLADRAIEMLHDLRAAEPDKPWLLYLAPGACHSPHQSPQAWRDRYRGRFDQGWDVWRRQTFERQIASGLLPDGTELSPRPDHVPAWDALDADEQVASARYMECFAAFLSHADHHVGRVIADLEERGELDDTLVIAISDNGASSEGGPVGSLNDVRTWNLAPNTLAEAVERLDEIGGPTIHNNYPWGWTIAGNTPFKRWKRETHEGGVADPMIVHWPNGMAARGERRRQYVHAVDLVPTILEAIGLEAPEVIDGHEQRPVEGTSFHYCLDDAAAADRHVTQHYEMLGCRAIYHDGWKAVTNHPIATPHPEQAPWELYHVAVDPSECHDLAAAEPERLAELEALWWERAEAHQVLPLDGQPFDAIFGEERPYVAPRTTYTYWPGGGPVPEEHAPNVHDRTHEVTAHLGLGPAARGPADEVPGRGVLLVQGSVLGGWVLFVGADGHLHYAHNHVGLEVHRGRSGEPVPAGATTLGFRFERTGEHAGVVGLRVDGELVGSVDVPRFTPVRWAITGDGIQCGEHWGVPVVADYERPGRFSGPLHHVSVWVEGEPHVDPAAMAAEAIRRQ